VPKTGAEMIDIGNVSTNVELVKNVKELSKSITDNGIVTNKEIVNFSQKTIGNKKLHFIEVYKKKVTIHYSEDNILEKEETKSDTESNKSFSSKGSSTK